MLSHNIITLGFRPKAICFIHYLESLLSGRIAELNISFSNVLSFTLLKHLIINQVMANTNIPLANKITNKDGPNNINTAVSSNNE